MADGPGKYDDMATYVREQTGADATVVLVTNGKRGSGFAVQIPVHYPHEAIEKTLLLAEVLENAAKQMRADAERMRARIMTDTTSTEWKP